MVSPPRTSRLITHYGATLRRNSGAVAAFTVEAIRREQTDWGSKIYRTRAETLIARAAPDPNLWGPPSTVLGL